MSTVFGTQGGGLVQEVAPNEEEQSDIDDGEYPLGRDTLAIEEYMGDVIFDYRSQRFISWHHMR